MKKYNIWGSFSVDIDIDIEANNENEAEKKAKQLLKDSYYLDYAGIHHNPKSGVSFKLYIDEDED